VGLLVPKQILILTELHMPILRIWEFTYHRRLYTLGLRQWLLRSNFALLWQYPIAVDRQVLPATLAKGSYITEGQTNQHGGSREHFCGGGDASG